MKTVKSTLTIKAQRLGKPTFYQSQNKIIIDT